MSEFLAAPSNVSPAGSVHFSYAAPDAGSYAAGPARRMRRSGAAAGIAGPLLLAAVFSTLPRRSQP